MNDNLNEEEIFVFLDKIEDDYDSEEIINISSEKSDSLAEDYNRQKQKYQNTEKTNNKSKDTNTNTGYLHDLKDMKELN